MNKIISFSLCPFVQRSLITLNHKKAPYEVEYIDLANKPEWFLKISPMGKVPVLQTKDTVLFESAVINEYLDEIHTPSLHPKDPLKKARERAIIEFSSHTLLSYFHTVIAKDKEGFDKNLHELQKNLKFLLADYKGPFYRGTEFSLVDTATIPLIQRLMLTPFVDKQLILADNERAKLNQWAEATLNLPEVKHSVPENFDSEFIEYLKGKESYLSNNI